jgi:hypothetical protein
MHRQIVGHHGGVQGQPGVFNGLHGHYKGVQVHAGVPCAVLERHGRVQGDVQVPQNTIISLGMAQSLSMFPMVAPCPISHISVCQTLKTRAKLNFFTALVCSSVK